MDKNELGSVLVEQRELRQTISETERYLQAFANELGRLAGDIGSRPQTVFFDGAPGDIQRVPDSLLGQPRYKWAILSEAMPLLRRIQSLRDMSERLRLIERTLDSGNPNTIRMDWDNLGVNVG